MFQRYTPDDFDQHGYFKAPKGFYLLLVVLLRPYIIWVLSVANRSESTLLIKQFYPDKTEFFIGLSTGIGALLVFALYSLRRKEAYRWVSWCWQYSKLLLWLTLLADSALFIYVLKTSHFNFQPEHGAVFLALFFAGLYLYSSRRLGYFLKDWPEALVDDKTEETA